MAHGPHCQQYVDFCTNVPPNSSSGVFTLFVFLFVVCAWPNDDWMIFHFLSQHHMSTLVVYPCLLKWSVITEFLVTLDVHRYLEHTIVDIQTNCRHTDKEKHFIHSIAGLKICHGWPWVIFIRKLWNLLLYRNGLIFIIQQPIQI